VVLRKPLLLPVLRVLARRGAGPGPVAADATRDRTCAVLTAILGTTFVAHAVTLLILALTLPTGTFLALSRVVGLSVVGAGAVVLFWYRNRRGVAARSHTARHATEAVDPRPGEVR
jgi:hypothetical protein